MNQNDLDIAVDIATRCALMGNPVERIIYIPKTSASDSPEPNFAIKYSAHDSASLTPSWDDN